LSVTSYADVCMRLKRYSGYKIAASPPKSDPPSMTPRAVKKGSTTPLTISPCTGPTSRPMHTEGERGLCHGNWRVPRAVDVWYTRKKRMVVVPGAGGRMGADFVHLHTHSHYSLLDGVPSPAELVQQAVALKMRALAL